MNTQTSRPEIAFVLLLMQATFWTIAGLSAFPFALAGELFMIVLGLTSLVLASAVLLLGLGVVLRNQRARKWAIRLEWLTLVGSLLLVALPIGANHGPVSLMVNIVLPAAVIWLLRGKKMKAAFATA